MHISLDNAPSCPDGSYRAACPRCARKRYDDAVHVTVSGGTALWYCHRCESGGKVGGASTTRRPIAAGNVLGQRWSDKAEFVWQCGRPLTQGDPVVRYLLQRRCALPTAEVRLLSPSPPRYAFPTMLARVTDAATGAPLTLHFTQLSERGAGKAPVDTPRRLLGGHQKRNGVVRLGSTEDGLLGIAEGVETALSVGLVEGMPMWACLDAANLESFPVLPDVDTLHVWADNDLPTDRYPAGRGQAAAAAVTHRWRQAGRQVLVHVPRKPGTDWNDVVAELLS